ncbi:hypothetical protein GCM10010383_48540 [Streptomyces lomondensis]|uniref:Uncharacterized protein n=1 Tax=Streptomyces lomondensis TaxID=68229 RepID=A0ABQ2XE85_9ACTN|nr:hypothetical protein GCM10010383_48540 [Streptomyces lomondensis]
MIRSMVRTTCPRRFGIRGFTSPPSATMRRAGSVFAVTLRPWERFIRRGDAWTGRGDVRSYLDIGEERDA